MQTRTRTVETYENDQLVESHEVTYEITDAQVVEESLHTEALAAITKLRTSVDTLATIAAKTNAQITAADTKAVARETRRVARQLIAVTRLLTRQLDSADLGQE